jgi:hypothetical protein
MVVVGIVIVGMVMSTMSMIRIVVCMIVAIVCVVMIAMGRVSATVRVVVVWFSRQVCIVNKERSFSFSPRIFDAAHAADHDDLASLTYRLASIANSDRARGFFSQNVFRTVSCDLRRVDGRPLPAAG